MRILQCLYSAHTKTGCCTRTITPAARDAWLSFITQSPLPISLEPHQSWRIALTLSHAFDLIILLIRTHQAPYSAGIGIRSLRTSAGLVLSLPSVVLALSLAVHMHRDHPPGPTTAKRWEMMGGPQAPATGDCPRAWFPRRVPSNLVALGF